MVSTRLISGLLGGAIGIFLILTGGIPLLLAAFVIAVAGLIEIRALFSRKGLSPDAWVMIPGGVLLLIAGYLNAGVYVVHVAALVILASLATQLLRRGAYEALAGASGTAFGTLYVGLPMAYLLMLRNLPGGAGYLMGALLAVWASDTGAYFGGMWLGRTRLWPRVSPNKTLEGSIIGICVAVLAVVLVNHLALASGWWSALPVSHAVGLGVLLSLSGQLGDLCESALKRDAGVKDSGRFLPGHGGALDRFDSVLFAAPIAYYYIKFFVAVI
ncbi:MAG TPA: phosphatidate cytidylyltransferase [Firmicutes bacterium]|nr:phosphatidate cytidylyltransferase [Bacillota bacterium]